MSKFYKFFKILGLCINQSEFYKYCYENPYLLSQNMMFKVRSQPGVAKEIWGNEVESWLAVAYVFSCCLHKIKENHHFRDLRLGSCLAVA